MFEREKICAQKREMSSQLRELKMRNFTTFTTITAAPKLKLSLIILLVQRTTRRMRRRRRTTP